jgi:hypothetical protein
MVSIGRTTVGTLHAVRGRARLCARTHARGGTGLTGTVPSEPRTTPIEKGRSQGRCSVQRNVLPRLGEWWSTVEMAVVMQRRGEWFPPSLTGMPDPYRR